MKKPTMYLDISKKMGDSAAVKTADQLISDLDAKLKVAVKALEFYASKENWKVCEQYKPWKNYSVIKGDLKTTEANYATQVVFAGMHASEALEKIKAK